MNCLGNQFTSIVVEDFFEQFDLIKDEFKKIPLYDSVELTKLNRETFNLTENGGEETWPGSRSEPLFKVSPFLEALFLQTFDNKFKNFFADKKVSCKTSLHLRLDKDDTSDWIHQDNEVADYSLLVYLSDTNLQSGTGLYNPKKELITDVKFVQNRAFLFTIDYFHKAIGNHGNDIHDCRLTFNAFFRIG